MANELVNVQGALFIECLKVGIMMGMVYDLIRIFRKLVYHFDWLVHLEDLLYWVGCSFLGFGMLYMHNYAEIRLFAFLGIAIGAVGYFVTLSVIFMKIATKCIEILRQIVSYIIHIALIPVKWTIKVLTPYWIRFKKMLRKLDKNRHKRVREWKRGAVVKNADVKTSINVMRNRKDLPKAKSNES
ncbi:MAG: hypothetical protein ATN36_03015 [Epulopiscium sp. Nele67-Bin005]|nr:MAG: hypothetical protein ATN36_03015 [Epulopiscium sp. Nele67-Bin005]